jgi:4-hydroxy-3-methylbut-2-enyl diphosphate reductase
MHILNHLIGSKSDQYNDPERASFYTKYRVLLSLLAILAGGAGLIIAYTLGTLPFVILLAMSLLGLSYNLRLVPKPLALIRYSRIRDVPGSKTVLIAVAWGTVTTVLPALVVPDHLSWNTGFVFLWVTGIVFVRTAFFDILDMQGDRIVGKETIPILLGEKRSLRLLKAVLAATTVILVPAAAFQLISNLGFILVICPAAMYFILRTYERSQILPSIKLEFLIETNFILAGVLSFLWTLWVR